MATNTNSRPASRPLRVDPWLIPAALLGLIPILSLLRPGMAGTSDGYVHLLRTLQVTELMKWGQFYPQWAPDFYVGYGYPFFLFYAPGAHILSALFALLGLGVPAGLVATQVLSMLLYGTGAYLAARRLFDELAPQPVLSMAALASAALYVYAPLRMRELFIQGNLSQLVALSLLPWCVWALLPAVRRGSLRWAAAAAVFLAGLLYAHHPSAFLAYPLFFAVGLAVLVLRPAPRRQSVSALLAAFGLALALSAPFWLPWLLESGYGSLGAMESGSFNAALNLVPADELFSPTLVLDRSSINSPQPLTLGLAHALLALAGGLAAVVLFARARTETARQAAALLLVVGALLLLSLALMLPLAAPLWTSLPLARVIAFPWRLLGPAGLLAALLGGAPLLLLQRRPALVALFVVLFVAPLSVAPLLFPAASLWRPVAAGGLTLADIGRYESQGGARGTASANEYLPRWVEDPNVPTDLLPDYEAGRLPERIELSSLPVGSRAETVRSTPLETIHRLSLIERSAVTIRRFYYPGWRAFIDGKPAEIRPSSPHGLIEVDVPSGERELRVAWGSTPPRLAGWVLFALGAGVTAWLLLTPRRGRRQDADSAPCAANSSGPWLLVAGFIVLLAGAKALWVEPRTDWFRLASPPDAPAGMTHRLAIRFENGVELLGYDLPQTEAQPGGELRLRLFWRTNRPLSEDFRSFAHLDAPVTGATWANQTKELIGKMPSSKWPVGFFVVDDFRLTVPRDAQPVSADLTVGLLTEGGENVSVPGEGELLKVGEIAIREAGWPSSRPPAPQGAYRLGEDIRLEGYRATQSAGEVELTLYWRAGKGLDADYTVFAQALDKEGRMVGQLDGPPCSGECPTSRWTPGGLIEDRRRIPLQAETATNGLSVNVGLYDHRASGARLRVVDAKGAESPDRAIRVEVASP